MAATSTGASAPLPQSPAPSGDDTIVGRIDRAADSMRQLHALFRSIGCLIFECMSDPADSGEELDHLYALSELGARIAGEHAEHLGDVELQLIRRAGLPPGEEEAK